MSETRSMFSELACSSRRVDLFLHVGAHFPVVQADAPLRIQGGRAAVVQEIAEQAQLLLQAGLVKPPSLHHLVEHRDVQGHRRDHGAGPGDQGLVDRNQGPAAGGGQLAVQLARRGLQVLLGLADGPVPIDRGGEGRADVGEGHGERVPGQQPLAPQRLDPQPPVLSSHDLHGVADLLADWPARWSPGRSVRSGNPRCARCRALPIGLITEECSVAGGRVQAPGAAML